jgi:hypothetical protein
LVLAALDEAQFGRDRILNLRMTMPTGADAVRRADAWLRERQASSAGEVLVITGRGRGSADGIPVVREAIVRLFAALRRGGVIAGVREHTAGAFVVRLASLQSLVDAPRRRRQPHPAAPDPTVLHGLDAETLALLRRLSAAALIALGVRHPSDEFVADEMRRQFSKLSLTVPSGPGREGLLRAVLLQAIDEYL